MTARLWGLLLFVAGAAHALPDPTLPPPQARASATGAGVSAVPEAPARPVLQGIRPGNQPTALISGRLLRPGQTVQGHVVLRIEIDSVVLRGPQGERVRLTLWSRDDKKSLTKEVRP